MKKTPGLSEKQSLKKLAEFNSQSRAVRIFQNFQANAGWRQAYLFSGGSRDDRREMTRSLAAFLNCLAPAAGDFCGQCAHCRSLENQTAPAWFEIRIEKAKKSRADDGDDSDDQEENRASIGIDQIRNLIKMVRYGADSGWTYKIVVINRADDMTSEAQNAFLKILEEPAGGVIFFLLNDNPYRLKETILSRCQSINFNQNHDFSDIKMGRNFPEGVNLAEALNRYFELEVPGSAAGLLGDLGDLLMNSRRRPPLSRLVNLAAGLFALTGSSEKIESREKLKLTVEAFIVLIQEKMNFLFKSGQPEAAGVLKNNLRILTRSLADWQSNGNIILGLDIMFLRLGDYVQ